MTKYQFKKLILLWWFLGVLGVVLSLTTQKYLPEEILAYYDRTANAEPTLLEWFAIGAGMALLVTVIIASIGLYRFTRWGRTLFLWSHVLLIFISPIMGVEVLSPWTTTLSYLYTMLTGGILFVMYLPPISFLFEYAEQTK